MRVLIVEDEKRITDAIRDGLKQEKFAVDVAYIGTDGYDLASTEDYDVIVLDWMLPEMDGVTICTRLRSANIHTPILLLTAKSLTNDIVDGLDCGADDYLTKPFEFEELISRIRALSRRPRQTLHSKHIADDLILDSTSFEVSRDGKPIFLSSKEFAILEYLLRNKGSIINKQQIIDHVWNFDDDVLPNTVEVNIRNIRHKIEKDFTKGRQLIKTVRGFGYTIE